MFNKNSIFLFLIILIVLLIKLILINPHDNKEKNNTRLNKQKKMVTSKKNIDRTNSTAQSDNKNLDPAHETPSNFIDEVLNCVPLNYDAGFVSKEHLSLNETFDYLNKAFGSPKVEEFDWQNTHIKLPNGEIRRIRVYSDITADERKIKELQFFKLDHEDLPVHIKIPKSDSYNPSNAVIKKYLSKGDVFFKEDAFTLHFKNNTYMKVIKTNNLVTNLEVHLKNKYLRCVATSNQPIFCECFK